eukprot:m.156823 g.156823  ORF g.156823 m.156823 type:complete len:410 (+) comp31028_c2_seq2:151-1380(+)
MYSQHQHQQQGWDSHQSHTQSPYTGGGGNTPQMIDPNKHKYSGVQSFGGSPMPQQAQQFGTPNPYGAQMGTMNSQMNHQSPQQFNHNHHHNHHHQSGNASAPYAPMVMSPQQSTSSPWHGDGAPNTEIVGSNALLGGSKDPYRPYQQQQQNQHQQQQEQHGSGKSAFHSSPFAPPASYRAGDIAIARVNGIPRTSVKDLFSGQVQGTSQKDTNMQDGFSTPTHHSNGVGTPLSQFASANPIPSAAMETPGHIDPFYTQSERLKYGLGKHEKPECSVTVYGFPPEGASFVLREFELCGTITKKKIEQGGNWMHLQYSTKTEAEKALGKDGKTFEGKLMIGVRRCIDTAFLGAAVAPANKVHVLNSPKEVRKPPRNLMQHSSTTGTGTPTQNTPRKDAGYLSLASDYLFGV